MQLTSTHKVATPANWKDGDDVIIVPSVSDEEAKESFPDGWETLKPYLRVVKQPREQFRYILRSAIGKSVARAIAQSESWALLFSEGRPTFRTDLEQAKQVDEDDQAHPCD